MTAHRFVIDVLCAVVDVLELTVPASVHRNYDAQSYGVRTFTVGENLGLMLGVDVRLAAPSTDDQLLAVHEALDKFALQHPLQAEVVKLRYFAGMTNEEVAQLLGISISTAKNYWNFSRGWLFNEIQSK